MKPVKLQPRKRWYKKEAITKLKNTLEGFSSRLDELKDKKKKGTQIIKGKIFKKRLKILLRHTGDIKQDNNHTIGFPEWKEREDEPEKLFSRKRG